MSITNSNGKRPLPEDEASTSGVATKMSKSEQTGYIALSEDTKKIKLRPGTAKNYKDGVRYSESGRELWKIGAKEPTVPYGTLGASERKEWKHEKKRQVREYKKAVQRERKDARKKKAIENARAKKAGRAAKAAAGTINSENHNAGTGEDINEQPNGHASGSVSAPNNPAGIEYEDVSAEATARLKAKEAAKEAAKNINKGSLKRKRESLQVGDFYEDLDAAPAESIPTTSAPAPARQSSTPKKPMNKKFKKTGASPGLNGDGKSQSTRGKRKRAADDEGTKPARPKRDKSKYNKATRKTGKYKHGQVTGANMTAVGSRA